MANPVTIAIDGAALASADTIILDDGERDLGALWAVTPDTALPQGYGDQIVTGTSLADFFYGHVGRDVFNGKSGDDAVYGGSQADTLNGGNGDDTLDGGDGEDSLIGGNGDDLLAGGRGANRASGGAGADTYRYTFGDGDLVIDDKGYGAGDRLEFTGLEDASVAVRSEGADLVYTLAGSGEVRIKAFAQDRGAIETITTDGAVLPSLGTLSEASLEPSRIEGTPGDDRLIGGPGKDVLVDGAGRDNLFGGAGGDVFELSADGVADSIKDFDPGADRIDLSAWGASSFADLALSPAAGKVILRIGAEVLAFANKARDLKPGDVLADHFIFAVPAGDVVGTDGDDKLFGSAADDRLVDGAGRDNLFGGAGRDTFALVADGAADAIKDFQHGLDLIDLSAWGASGFGDLRINDGRPGKVAIRYGAERRSISDADQSLRADALTADDLLF